MGSDDRYDKEPKIPKLTKENHEKWFRNNKLKLKGRESSTLSKSRSTRTPGLHDMELAPPHQLPTPLKTRPALSTLQNKQAS
ncbi:hypothetical protein A1F94_002036 [Pyrenophora tritici-repentis]|nr:hypothetical protein A1F94_002036 [Pyrenophora tritici-repentis]